MKKPPEKKSSSKKDEGIKVTGQMIGKVLDIGKELASTGNNLIGLAKEIQHTKVAAINANAKVMVAKEATATAGINAATEVTRIHSDNHKDKMGHELEMARLQMERENMTALNRQRERVLDKMLQETESNGTALAQLS